MVPDLRLAIQLQDLDKRIVHLQHEIAALPKHISAIAKTLESHIRKLEADRAALTANQKERKRLEGEVQAHEQKISKLRDQMLQAKTNDQYAAFKHEIDFCQAEIKKCEDKTLERMGESEPLEKAVTAAEASLAKEKQQVEAEKTAARQRTGGDQDQLKKMLAERQKIVSEMSPEIVRSYDRIRRTRKGIAVAEAIDGRCSACHMALRLQFYQELRRMDRVMYCESCARILYYIAPVEADNLGAEQPQQAGQASEV